MLPAKAVGQPWHQERTGVSNVSMVVGFRCQEVPIRPFRIPPTRVLMGVAFLKSVDQPGWVLVEISETGIIHGTGC